MTTAERDRRRPVFDIAVFRPLCGPCIVDTADSGYAEAVPYQLSFTAAVTVTDGRSRYINDCCWGGDVIRNRLMPVVAERYQEVRTEQEDWGWFIWFRDGAIRLAVDIFCDDIPSGAFRVRLTSRRKKANRFRDFGHAGARTAAGSGGVGNECLGRIVPNRAS